MTRRTILSALAFAVFAPAMAAQAAPSSPVQVTNITVNSLVPNLNDPTQLIANATMTLNVAGRTITQNVTFPVTPTITPQVGSCPILNLSLGPIHLDLLGLIVNLDNCAGGAVTVKVTAISGSNNLLGNLLCSLTGLLNGGGLNLAGILATLNNLPPIGNVPALAVFESGLTNLLNALLTKVLSPGAGTLMTAAPAAGSCPILDLHINPLDINPLGLRVQTSAICLDISAQRGNGNLLGNLLCALVNVLNTPANGAAINALLGHIAQLLTNLGL